MIVWVLLCGSFICLSLGVTPEEIEALEDFYQSTNGGGWSISTNWFQEDSDPCDWFGVNCEGPDVTNIRFFGNNLTGNLPSSKFVQLINLQTLSISDTSISGTLPSSWSSLSELESLLLISNDLNGPLPASWKSFANLNHMHLMNNSISGTLPPEWGSFSSLRSLDLSLNSISGPLPSQWSSFPNLGLLGLVSNSISGTLPPEWGSMANMTILALGSNSISGILPPEWSLLSNLSALELENNKLNGSFPESWMTLPMLEHLKLSHNHLTYSLPSTLPAMQGTEDMEWDLQFNEFYCELPDWCEMESANICSPCVPPSESPSNTPSNSPSNSRSNSPSLNTVTTSVSESESPTQSPSNSESSTASISGSDFRSLIILGPSVILLPTGIQSIQASRSSGSLVERSQTFYHSEISVGIEPSNGYLPDGTSISIDTEDGNPPRVIVTFPDPPEDRLGTQLISSVVDFTLADDSQSFKSAEICFSITQKATSESCLGYFNTQRQEWVCEDHCLKENDQGQVCGSTSHFTSFAILFRGLSGGTSGDCGGDDFDNITGSYEGDLILVFVIFGVAILVVFVVGSLSRSALANHFVYGKEGNRVNTLRTLRVR